MHARKDPTFFSPMNRGPQMAKIRVDNRKRRWAFLTLDNMENPLKIGIEPNFMNLGPQMAKI